MTALVTRTPLQTLSMTGAQTNGVKRKSIRHVFDPEDDAPPPKKTKAPPPAKHASQTAMKTRSKKSYDEDDDGFTFSRAAPKRAAKKASNDGVDKPAQPPAAEPRPQPQSRPQPEPSQHPPVEDTAPSEPAPPPRKKPRKTLPVTPERDAPRRRSKRLSGNSPSYTVAATKTPVAPLPPDAEAQPTPQPTTDSAPDPSDRSPGPENNDLTVQKKRGPAKIPLPFGETPVLRRNKEMRKISAEKSRRSSSGMRGRRASSLIETGSSRAVPHTQVETPEFYKHISQGLVEPKRMRQLLMWCGHRALPEKGGGQMDAAETAAMHAARVIQEELLDEFGTRGNMSYWYDREDTAPAVLVKKPNPRNIQNAEKLPQLEAELARLQEEKRSWEKLLASTSSKKDEGSAASQTPMALDASTIDSSLLDPSQTEILQTLFSNVALNGSSLPDPQQSQAVDTVTNTRQRIGDVASSLEFKIDKLADGAHRIAQYRQTAERLADRVLSVGAQKLEDRDEVLKERSGGGVDAMDKLRGLSRVLGRKKGAR